MLHANQSILRNKQRRSAQKHMKQLTLVAVGGRPSRVKAMPGSQCRSVTQVVWLASTRDMWLPFTTAFMPLSSLLTSSLLLLASRPAGRDCAMRSCTTRELCLIPTAVCSLEGMICVSVVADRTCQRWCECDISRQPMFAGNLNGSRLWSCKPVWASKTNPK